MKRTIPSILSLLVIAVATFCLAGHVFNVPALYLWPKGRPGVAAPTAMLFLTLGCALFMVCQRDGNQPPPSE